MILNNTDLIKLKVLVLGETDEEDKMNCMDCKPNNPNCNLIDTCNRYGSFSFVGGAENMIEDLFDTIESLKDKIRITVIATGFGEKDQIKKATANPHAYTPNPVFVRKTVEDKGLFASNPRNEVDDLPQARIPTFSTEEVVEKPVSRSAPASSPKPVEDDEDLEIPAFLRRKMK